MIRMKVYNFYKEDCEVSEANTKLLHRVMGLEVEDILPEDNTRLVDAYEVCTAPTTVFLNSKDEVVTKIIGKVTVEDLEKIMS